MTCPSCESAKTNPHSGLYHADCESCQARMFDQALPLHLGNLKSIPASVDRRAYIDTIERKHGKPAADKLKAAFTEWWGHK